MRYLVYKRARFDYEIINSFEAGIKLNGSEVKSLRKSHGSLKESYITVNDEVFLIGAHIPPFQGGHKDMESYDPYRKRKLLLHQKEIQQLKAAQKEKGLTVIPLQIYSKGNLIKIEIAIARGKKQYDKRHALKDRTAQRDAERAMHQRG